MLLSCMAGSLRRAVPVLMWPVLAGSAAWASVLSCAASVPEQPQSVQSAPPPAVQGAAGPKPAPVLNSDHDPLAFGPDTIPPGRLVAGRRGMVVSAQHLASDAGAQILREGGNAVDAAVAVGYALAVVYPAAGSLGGGGFMTLYLGPHNNNPGPGNLRHEHTIFMDFRERAPGAARADMFLDAQGQPVPGLSTHGWKAVAVPGTVAGLEAIRERWGRLSREKDMAPAIALARDGFVLDQGDVDLLGTALPAMRQDPYARGHYLRPGGQPLQVGDRLVQKNLARTLEAISREGEEAFYQGPIARELVRISQAEGGLLTLKDFADYHVRFMRPLRCSYRGYLLHTAPPPSAGGVTLCEMLGILEGYDMRALGLHTAPAVQKELEAMRHAYSDRRVLGDPAFVQVPTTHLVDPFYARSIRQTVPADHALPSAGLQAGKAQPDRNSPAEPVSGEREKHETTQFSIMDAQGMAVSTTFTLNGWFGAGVMGGQTGIWMNDEMDDFSIKPGAPNMFGIVGSAANAIAPGKTPLSSMAPTIVTRAHGVVMVLGSPGGSRIPTTELSGLLGLIDYDLDLRQAVVLPRIHEQWAPTPVEVEPGALTPEVTRILEGEGYKIVPHRPWGMLESILVGRPKLSAPASALLYGVADPRHPGGAAVAEVPVSQTQPAPSAQ
ncbi:gamma-glutamyltransferase [Oecophyllibacter saccharovorans]|uniref:gamma-glutamyltransferase n=1 Tax=Oecophyllibacter saccharovorans TaxID=2558360 RepID=UPI001F4F1D7E|nr:gamma-glutamyltransferase [Oecophyllibacter saccharovorans]